MLSLQTLFFWMKYFALLEKIIFVKNVERTENGQNASHYYMGS